jgi:hypothetical protein
LALGIAHRSENDPTNYRSEELKNSILNEIERNRTLYRFENFPPGSFCYRKTSKKNKLFKVILDLSDKCIPNAALLGF